MNTAQNSSSDIKMMDGGSGGPHNIGATNTFAPANSGMFMSGANSTHLTASSI